MARQPAPRWQPIARLPTIAALIDGMLDEAEEHYRTLGTARSRPAALDDRTLDRVVAVFGAQRDDLWLFEEQLRRWDAQALTAAQRREVARLADQAARLRATVAAILALADELRGGTIERVLAQDDLALGLAVLRGEIVPAPPRERAE